MTLHVLCTSKPCDGLFYYSYEYTHYLNSIGIETKCVILPHPDFHKEDYVFAVEKKYKVFDFFEFAEDVFPNKNDITLVMGRSIITLPYLNKHGYTSNELISLNFLLKKVIAVYSENHSKEKFYNACKYFDIERCMDIVDKQVYLNANGIHFEKHIYFQIYKDIKDDPQYKYLFNGTNGAYYSRAIDLIKEYGEFKKHGIMVYRNAQYLKKDFTHIICPIDNLLGLVEKYVYSKNYFDPAPRIIQECKYYGKEIIYCRDRNIHDGGSVYYNRNLTPPNASAIIKCIEELQ